MKGIDIFCASQASTAICLSMDQASSSSSSSILLGGRAIDRHNPIIRDGRRFTTPPCSSNPPPINPKPYHQLQKSKKISSKKSSSSSTDQNKKHSTDQKKKASFKSTDVNKKNSSSKPTDVDCKNRSLDMSTTDIKKKGCAKPQNDLFTPPGSSRYLLSDAAFLDGLSDYDPVLALVPVETNGKPLAVNKQEDESTAPKPSSSSHSEKPSSNQVVVLRVSLHCKGCAGKVRKHLSRMEGVTSFNIDFAAKKVTIVGDVTPLSVLASVSKVKNAQFWPTAPVPDPPSPSSASTAVSANNQEIKK